MCGKDRLNVEKESGILAFTEQYQNITSSQEITYKSRNNYRSMLLKDEEVTI